MGFSWVTFCAQIVNLFILMVLLKKFLYKPVLTAVEKRQQYIAHQIANARAATQAAQAEKDALTQERAAFKNQQNALLEAAAQEAARLKETLSAEVKADITAAHKRAQADLNRRVAEIDTSLRDFMIQNFLHLSGDILEKLCDTDMRQKATDVFLNQVRALPADEKKRLKDVIQTVPALDITTAQNLTKSGKEAFLNALLQTLTLAVPLKAHWHTDPTLLAGAEIRAGDMTVAWHLKACVETFETRLKNQMATVLIK